MNTGKVFESPRKAYFNMSDRGLSSNLRSSMIDETGKDVDIGKGSTLGFYRLVFMMGTKFNNVLTSSIDSYMSKFTPKWAKHFSEESS